MHFQTKQERVAWKSSSRLKFRGSNWQRLQSWFELLWLGMAIELKLSRTSRVYRPSVSILSLNLMMMMMKRSWFWTKKILDFQEAVKGKIIVNSPSSISHYGIRLTVNGSVNLQVRNYTLFASRENNGKEKLLLWLTHIWSNA